MGRYIWRASPTLGPLLKTGGKLKRPWRNSKNSQNRTMSLRSMFAGYYAALGDRDRASSGWKEVTGVRAIGRGGRGGRGGRADGSGLGGGGIGRPSIGASAGRLPAATRALRTISPDGSSGRP